MASKFLQITNYHILVEVTGESQSWCWSGTLFYGDAKVIAWVNRASHMCWEHGGLFKIWWGEGAWVNTEGSARGVKTLLKNTCDEVQLLIKLLDISLQDCKFTKNELLNTYFSRILASFYVIICVLEFQEHLFFKASFNVGFC